MTTRITMRLAALTTGAAILASGIAAPVNADDAFGKHVRDCAQSTGFDATMNPGMHQGYAGWTPEHTC